jgi:hypothetical protein
MMHWEDILNEDKDVVEEEYYDEFDDYYHGDWDRRIDHHDEELLLKVDDRLPMMMAMLLRECLAEVVFQHVIDGPPQRMVDW